MLTHMSWPAISLQHNQRWKRTAIWANAYCLGSRRCLAKPQWRYRQSLQCFCVVSSHEQCMCWLLTEQHTALSAYLEVHHFCHALEGILLVIPHFMHLQQIPRKAQKQMLLHNSAHNMLRAAHTTQWCKFGAAGCQGLLQQTDMAIPSMPANLLLIQILSLQVAVSFFHQTATITNLFTLQPNAAA